jgi:CheY-like chemotaxis protein
MGDQPVRVLVVDPSSDNAVSLALLLQIWGYEACLAFDGRAALNAFETFAPQVVIMEIALPHLDGWKVAQLLRQANPTSSLLLLALSGYGRDEDQARSLDAGFDFHLVKPADPFVIQALLARHCIAPRSRRSPPEQTRKTGSPVVSLDRR